MIQICILMVYLLLHLNHVITDKPPNFMLMNHVYRHRLNLDENSDAKKLQYSYTESKDWPIGANVFGQVTAVDVHENGNIIVFHRGDHVWNDHSFDALNHYRLIDDGPITSNTIVTIDPISRRIIHQWGSNHFYLPHGLTLDRNGSLWLTDVALHQVFKFPINGSQQPILTIGERFSPGNGETNFCKPTSVAISSDNGDLYIADGYCNSRIARFNANGKFLNQWGHTDPIGYFMSPPPGAFSIPHKVVLIEDKGLVCAADREHGRVQCFTYPHGQFQFEIRRDDFNGRLFSIAYSNYNGGILYAVSGPSLFQDQQKEVLGFAFNITTRELLGVFTPNSGTFVQPHDIGVSRNGSHVYVVEIGPNYVHMFGKGQMNDLNLLRVESNEKPLSFHTPDAVNIKDSIPKTDSISTIKTQAFTGPIIMKNATMKTTHINNTMLAQNASSVIPFKKLISSSNGAIVVSLMVVPMLLIIGFFIITNIRNGDTFNKNTGLYNGWFRRDRTMRSQEKFDLSRLINDPQKDGFNRVPIDENSDGDGDAEDNSDSETEDIVSSAPIAKV